ncbi:MAG: hypothetical protein ACP5OO_12585, partial [Chloroflexia bacterium]
MSGKFLYRFGVILALAGLLLGGWADAQTQAEQPFSGVGTGATATPGLLPTQPEQQEYRVLDTTRAQFLGQEPG